MMKKKILCISLICCILPTLFSACSFTEGFKAGFDEGMNGAEIVENGEEAATGVSD